MNKITQCLSLVLYLTVGRKLPQTFWPGGIFFSQLRACFLRGMGCQVGRHCEIEPGVDFGLRPKSIIGDRCQLNKNSTIRNAIIGSDVMIAPGVVILDRQHCFDRFDVPMSAQGSSFQQVQIDDDVWIGQNAIVLPGVKIGTGAIVGAGAVVTHDVAPRDIVCGVPAKVVRNRESN